jgi:hypothetical protein
MRSKRKSNRSAVALFIAPENSFFPPLGRRVMANPGKEARNVSASGAGVRLLFMIRDCAG